MTILPSRTLPVRLLVRGRAPAPAASLSPSTPATPSKKALARQRAKLRKKTSQVGLADSANATDSDVSSVAPASSALPPVPPLPTKVDVLDRVNGAKEQAAEKAEQVRDTVVKAAAPVVEAVAPAAQPVQDTARAAAPPTIVEPPKAPESVTSDEGESIAAYGSDDDEDDDEEEAAAATAPTSPYANSPRPASPAPPAATSQTVGIVDNKPKEAYTGADHDPNKKIKAIITRTVWGVVMAGGCIGLVCMGHVYVIALVFVCQATVFKELTALFDAGYAGSHAGAGVATRTRRRGRRRGRPSARGARRTASGGAGAWLGASSLFSLSCLRTRADPVCARAQVLLCRDKLLPLRREFDLLLQAHPHAPSGVPPDSLLVRPAPPPHQLWALRDRYGSPSRAFVWTQLTRGGM